MYVCLYDTIITQKEVVMRSEYLHEKCSFFFPFLQPNGNGTEFHYDDDDDDQTIVVSAPTFRLFLVVSFEFV